jgi:hypothetical protein
MPQRSFSESRLHHKSAESGGGKQRCRLLVCKKRSNTLLQADSLLPGQTRSSPPLLLLPERERAKTIPESNKLPRNQTTANPESMISLDAQLANKIASQRRTSPGNDITNAAAKIGLPSIIHLDVGGWRSAP